MEIASDIATKDNALSGRGIFYPIAKEGALKLKKSYIHAEAYPAGELKHGPLALMMRIFCNRNGSDSEIAEKLVSNLEEVKARVVFFMCFPIHQYQWRSNQAN